jgi:hypothetical protein
VRADFREEVEDRGGCAGGGGGGAGSGGGVESGGGAGGEAAGEGGAEGGEDAEGSVGRVRILNGMGVWYCLLRLNVKGSTEGVKTNLEAWGATDLTAFPVKTGFRATVTPREERRENIVSIDVLLRRRGETFGLVLVFVGQDVDVLVGCQIPIRASGVGSASLK